MSDPLAFGPFLLLEKSEREKLGQACVVLKLKQGDTLIEERSVGDDAYLLVDGSVRIVEQRQGVADLARQVRRQGALVPYVGGG